MVEISTSIGIPIFKGYAVCKFETTLKLKWDDFETHLPVDWWFHPVPAGFNKQFFNSTMTIVFWNSMELPVNGRLGFEVILNKNFMIYIE